MGDPVSWFLIRSGWKVVSADGHEIGRVEEVTGDETHDIFDGLAVARSALGRPRYVPAELVTTIEEGVVHLSLTRDEADRLDEYREPPAGAEAEAGDRGGAGMRSHPLGIGRRLALYVRRLVGR